MLSDALVHAVVAGVLASLACGLGVLPLMLPKVDPKRDAGIGYAIAGGLMVSASVWNLLLPALRLLPDAEGHTQWTLALVVPVLGGLIVGALFLSVADQLIDDHQLGDKLGGSMGGSLGLLVFLAMTIHSIPEGVAVGTAYAAEGTEYATDPQMGLYVALAIAIHNIPEGLAVAIPLRAAGVSLHRCFWLAVLTSVPQPIAAVPAVLAAWAFNPLMPWLLSFAGGAMIFLVVLELLPEALQRLSHQRVAWAFTAGFAGMMLVQVLL